MRMTREALTTLVWVVAVGAWGCSPDHSPDDAMGVHRPPPTRSSPDEPQDPTGGGDGDGGSVAFETDGGPRVEKFSYWRTPSGDIPTYFAHMMGSKTIPGLIYAEISNPSQEPRTVVAYADVDSFTKTRGSKVLELDPGETVELRLVPKLDFERIGAVNGATPTKLSLSLYTTSGEKLYETVKSTNVLPKGRVFDRVFTDKEGAPTGKKDRYYASVVMTTPKDPWGEIAKFVQEVGTYTTHHAMPRYEVCGAKPTFDEKRACCLNQLEAIHETLRARGTTITKLPDDFFSSGRDVRYPAETLRANEGNAFEVALVVVSALEAMKLDTGYNTMTKNVLPVIDVQLSGSEQRELYGLDPTVLPAGSFEDALKSAAALATEAFEQKDPWYDYSAIADARKSQLTPAPFPF